MTKAEKINLYADTLYGMCREVQRKTNKEVKFEIYTYASADLGKYSGICVSVKEESWKYYWVVEIAPDMEKKFKAAEDALNKFLIEVPCPYCDHIEKEDKK